MNPTDDQGPLKGLARAIDELFSTPEDPPADPAPDDPEIVGEAPEEAAEVGPTSTGRRAPSAVGEADPLMDMEMMPLEEPTPAARRAPAPEPGRVLDAIDLGDSEVPAAPGQVEDVVRQASALHPAAREQRPASDDAFAEFDGPAGVARSAGPAATHAEEPADPGAALETAVERYLAAEGVAREELGRRARELSARLGEERRTEPIADAVERLIVAADRHGAQEAPRSLARAMCAPEVAALLAARLGSARDEARRRQLVGVCAALGAEMAAAVGDALSATDDRSARRACMDALVALGDDAMPVMAEMVDDSRWFVVRNAVLLFGEIGGEASVHHLTTTLAHGDPRVRRETLLALAKIGGDDAAALVQNKIDDPDPQVRAASARAVGELGIERAVRALLARLESETDQDVQVAILRALGQIGDPGAVPTLEKRAVGGFFSKPPTEVRIAAYRALAAIGTPHAREVLEAAASGDSDVAVKAAAASAVARTGPGGG